MANLSEADKDTCRWAVWVGRHILEKISRIPQGQLSRDRNPTQSVRAKAGLMGPLNARGPEAKAWPNDPFITFGGCEW
jgi:hypothetical protein